MLNNKENIFLSILQENVKKKVIYDKTNNFNSDDWKELCEFAIKNKLFPAFYHRLLALKLNNIPPEVLSRFQNIYLNNLDKNFILQKELFRVLGYFSQANIPAIPLKGPFFVSYLYKDLGLRQASNDLDILIQQDRLNDAENALEILGYHTNEEKRLGHHKFNRQIPFSKKVAVSKVSFIDLHWSLRSRFVRTHTQDFWINAKQTDIDGFQILAPSNEDLLIYLALISMTDTTFVQIRYLYDIHRLITKFGKNMDWQVLTDRTKKLRFDATLFFALKLSQDLFYTDLPKGLIDTIKPNFIKRNLLKLWINKANVLGFKKRLFSNYVWIYLISSYCNSSNIFDCINIVCKKVFMSPKEIAWKGKDPVSKVSYFLSIKRVLIPFKRFFASRRDY